MRKRIILFTLSMVILASVSTAQASWESDLVNSQPLNPIRDNYLGDRVDDILAECGYGSYDTYTVLRNCYKWLINNVEYGINHSDNNPVTLYAEDIRTPKHISYNAYTALYENKGVCDNYAAAFYVLAQSIGLRPYLCGGQTAKASGGYTPHAWNEIEMNGKRYIFDAQIEDNVAKGGAVNYYFFCKTPESVSSQYIKDEADSNLYSYRCGLMKSGGYIADLELSPVSLLVNGMSMNLYKLNGETTYLCADELSGYGFDVAWSEADKSMNICYNPDKVVVGGSFYTASAPAYASDITASVEGSAVPAIEMAGKAYIQYRSLMNLKYQEFIDTKDRAEFTVLPVQFVNSVGSGFSDISIYSQNKEMLNYLKSIGVITGFEDGAFGACRTVTRAQFAAMVCRLMGADSDSRNAAAAFSDTDGHWANDYILMCKNKGIINGIDESHFNPDAPITNIQMLKILLSLEGYSGDYPNGYWKQAMAESLWEEAFVEQNVNRYTAAKMLYMIKDKI